MHSFVVTGGAGFIGSALVRRLLRDDVRVVVVDKLTYAGNLETLAPVAGHRGLVHERVDIADADAMDRVLATHEPEAILHLAAESHVDRSIDGPGDFIRTNVVGTFVLLDAAHRYLGARRDNDLRDRFRFIHVSTDEVFGSLGADGAFREDTPYDQRSPYSASKAGSDHLARAWFHTYGLPVIVTNCSNNYGPYQFPEKLIPLMILKCLEGRPLPVYGRGTNVRDWLYVDDHVEALLAVLAGGQVGRTYNIGGRAERANIDVVRAICGLLDEMVPDAAGPYERLISFVPDRPGHDLRYAMDTTRIGAELAWAPRESFDSGLRKTVRWYLDNRSFWERIRDGRYRGERLGLGR